MNLPFVIDVSISLFFIFLILSLLASELQELLTTLLQWRASHLKESIEVLLAGGVRTQQEEQARDLVNKLYNDPLIKNINQEAKGLAGSMRTITRYPQYLFPSNQGRSFWGKNRTSGPSYISPDTFATSLMEQLGLPILARKLIEVRLQKFATRVIGIYDVQVNLQEDGTEDRSIKIPADRDPRLKELWNKGRIRLMAERANQPHLRNLDRDRNFRILVEEFDDILNDFNIGETNLVTSVERMGESLSNYIANYPLPKSNNDEAESSQSQAEIAAIDQTEARENNPLSLSQNEDPDPVYFAKRLRAFKLGVFGEKSERAVASGALRPSLLEIAELINQSSSTYREVAAAYQELVTAGKELDKEVLPRLKDKLLETHVEVLEQQLAAKYLDEIEQQLQTTQPQAIHPFKKKLTAIHEKLEQALMRAGKPLRRRRGLFRRLRTWIAYQWQRIVISSPRRLKQQHKQIIFEISDRLPESTQQNLIATVLSTLTDQELYGDEANVDFGLIDCVLDQLTNEERRFLVDKVLTDLSQQESWDEKTDKKQRSLYEKYQTYKTIQQILGKLPNPVKESFAILARRAQARVQQTGNDINQFREEVSLWFDRSMSRASGVYKRNTKGVAILIGLILVAVTNVDAGFIVDRLSNDENLRNVVTEKAISLESETDLESIRTTTNEALKELALPIGWNPTNVAQQLGCPPHNSNELTGWEKLNKVCQVNSSPANKQPNQLPSNPFQAFISSTGNLLHSVAAYVVKYYSAMLRILFGWLIAGIAISMGAPFWFDMLGKFVHVRNSGSKPPSTEENQAVAKTSGAETTVK